MFIAGVSQERKNKIMNDQEYNREGYSIDIHSASPLILQSEYLIIISKISAHLSFDEHVFSHQIILRNLLI